jgi:hypothetical protein
MRGGSTLAARLKVTYADGRDEVVIASPRAQVETERHFTGLSETRQVETAFYLAWASLKWAGREGADFEAWLDKVTDVEEATPEVVDPTRTTQPSITSSS